MPADKEAFGFKRSKIWITLAFISVIGIAVLLIMGIISRSPLTVIGIIVFVIMAIRHVGTEEDGHERVRN